MSPAVIVANVLSGIAIIGILVWAWRSPPEYEDEDR